MTAMTNAYNRVSDDAVREATGKGWNEWFALLDESGAESMSHKAIAAMLATPDYLGPDGRWWAQNHHRCLRTRPRKARGRPDGWGGVRDRRTENAARHRGPAMAVTGQCRRDADLARRG